MSASLRYDELADVLGRLGYTQDAYNSEFIPKNLVKGNYRVQIVTDSPNDPVGHILVTYAR